MHIVALLTQLYRFNDSNLGYTVTKQSNRYVRSPRAGSYIRSAYAVEANPWTPQEDLEAAIFFRGAIVSSFGYIETCLGEVCIQTSRLQCYAELTPNFPYSTSKRVAHLRKAFAIGPLEPFHRTATAFLDRFDATGPLRNMVTHARMQVLSEWGVTFEHYPKQVDGGVQHHSTRLTIAQLESRAWETARLSRLCQHLQFLLNATKALEVASD